MTAMNETMAEGTDIPAIAEPADPGTAEEQRDQVSRPNRNIALLLFGTTLIILASAFGVAVLVSYESSRVCRRPIASFHATISNAPCCA